MANLWHRNFKALIDKPFDIFPSKNQSETDKINSIARLGMYLIVAIIVFRLDNSVLTIPILLITTSFFLGRTEGFISERRKNYCYKPTASNPFMNFTLDDHYKNPGRPANCPVPAVRNEMRKEFLKRIIPDPTDLWGQNFSDRSFYTMPSTRVVNDQKNFAKSLYGTIGQCKTFGINCVEYARSRTGTGMFGSAI
tara:strand:+ start:5519 stop:6103 length:585 start_codon:yes stop_codon:yes gene_type:complete